MLNSCREKKVLDFSLCASSTIFPDRILDLLIASSQCPSFTASVSNRCLMCSARLFAMLFSVLVEGFCTTLTLRTRRHDVLVRFGPRCRYSSPFMDRSFTSTSLSSSIERGGLVISALTLSSDAFLLLTLCSSVLFFCQVICVSPTT